MSDDTVNLNVGEKFNDYEQLSTSLNAFCKEQYHPFVIRTRSQKQVLYKCCHGVKKTSKCQGIRPNQHYYYKGCPAQINFYKGKNGKWTLTKMLLDHNHLIGKKQYYRYYGRAKKMNEDENDTATDLLLSTSTETDQSADTEEEVESLFIAYSEKKTIIFYFTLLLLLFYNLHIFLDLDLLQIVYSFIHT